ncbi:MAG: ABC transporter ATP-binding protein [Planctomycetota bacterium]|jgi:ATP-binding cassette subfamily B protein
MKYSDLALLKRLLLWARPYWPHIAGILALSLLAAPLALLTPVPLKITVDSVIGTEPLPGVLDNLLPIGFERSAFGNLVVATLLVVLIALMSQLQAMGTALLSTYTAEKLVLGFRAKLFRHLQRLSLSYHDLRGTSDSTYRIQHDGSAIQFLVIDGMIPFATACFTLTAMLYVTFRLDWQLGLVALCVSPPLAVLARTYRRHVRRRAHRVKRLESSVLGVIQEVLTGLRIVKAFGQEEREQGRFVRTSHEGMRARLGLALAEGSMGLLLGLTVSVGTAAVLFIGVRNVLGGALTLGELLLIMAYLAQLYRPLRTISRKVASLQLHIASVERMFRVLDRAPNVTERPGARSLARADGAVTFDGVSFGYGDDVRVLHDVSLDVPVGTRVGVAGETGSGKTTLVSLLSRFYDPTEGRITLDDVDLRDYKLTDLRRQFAIVLQEPMLFSTSIAENIAYAEPEANHEAIVRAARAANAHDFINRLPEGYDTQVGERGLRLSGGERQRIALARAFLRDAPILIMDEPTSAVDLETEAGILEAMDRLMVGRTCFLITHRPSTLTGCDLIVSINRGRLSLGGGPTALRAVQE